MVTAGRVARTAQGCSGEAEENAGRLRSSSPFCPVRRKRSPSSGAQGRRRPAWLKQERRAAGSQLFFPLSPFSAMGGRGRRSARTLACMASFKLRAQRFAPATSRSLASRAQCDHGSGWRYRVDFPFSSGHGLWREAWRHTLSPTR